MPTTPPPDTGPPTRVVSTAAASTVTATPSSGAPTRRLGLALAVIATAQLMVVLDGTIVNVALPHIQTALGFSGTNLEWVVNAYTLVFGGLLLLGGIRRPAGAPPDLHHRPAGLRGGVAARRVRH